MSNSFKLYCKSVLDHKVLSLEEEQILIQKIKLGDQKAKDLFINVNLKLVNFIAYKYRDSGIDMQDLIQEGIVGLLIALDRFEPERGFKFSTYANFYIKKSIRALINSLSNDITRPEYVRDAISRYKMNVDNLSKELGHEPSRYEISNNLNIPVNLVDEYYFMQQPSLKIDDYGNLDYNTSIRDSIPDTNVDVENEVLTSIFKEDIRYLLENSNLTDKEKMVVYYVFGFDGSSLRSYAEAGRILGMQREVVRKIILRSLKKLKAYLDCTKEEKYKK